MTLRVLWTWLPCVSTWFSSQQVYFLPMHHVWKITFMLEEEAFDPDCSQRDDESGSDDLPWLQFRAAGVDLSPALLQVHQEHLLIHFQGTLDTRTHASVTICEGCFGFTKYFTGAEHHFNAMIFAFHLCSMLDFWVLCQSAHIIYVITAKKSTQPYVTANISVDTSFLVTKEIRGSDDFKPCDAES